jgi:REP element-mobilizing transposase RayT
MSAHLGWNRRGYLPHFDAACTLQHVVFRLADSLPPAMRDKVAATPNPDRLAAADQALDAGLGSKALRDPRIAALVQSSLEHFDSDRYDLLAWCVMPTHAHVLVLQRDGWPLAPIVQGWKSVTARGANAHLERHGKFWARDYFDRAIRENEDPSRVADYIEHNPVAAGLCADPRDWRWSSAFQR